MKEFCKQSNQLCVEFVKKGDLRLKVFLSKSSLRFGLLKMFLSKSIESQLLDLGTLNIHRDNNW